MQSDSAGLGCSLRACASNKLPSDADAVGLGTTVQQKDSMRHLKDKLLILRLGDFWYQILESPLTQMPSVGPDNINGRSQPATKHSKLFFGVISA